MKSGYTVKVLTEAINEPIDLQLVKEQLRIDYDDEDSILSSYIRLARDEAEKITRRSIAVKTYELKLEKFPINDGVITLPYPPIKSITSITYKDYAGVVYTLSTDVYELDVDNGTVNLKYNQTYPTSVPLYPTNPITITYIAGYDEVPMMLKIGMAMLVGHFYENRESSADKAPQMLQLGHESLFTKYKAGWFL